MSRLDKILQRNRDQNARQTRKLIFVAAVVVALVVIGILLALGIGLPRAPEHRVNDIQLRSR